MRSKNFKIITSILLVLMMLMMSSTSLARKTINGVEYHTANDFNWIDGHIYVNNGPFQGHYYCTNHGRVLDSMLMTDDIPVSVTKTIDWERIRGITDKTDLSTKKSAEAAIRTTKLQDEIQAGLSTSTNKTATIAPGVTSKARDPLEAAIYAFAKTAEFNISTEQVQHAIWNYGSLIGESDKSEEVNPILWNAALAYVDWAGYDPVDKNSKDLYTGDQGTFKTQNNQPNLTVDNTDAKVNINYDNQSYVVGPIAVTYDAGFKCDEIKFTKDFEIKFIKQDGTEVKSAQIINAEGNTLSELPNGEGFFVEFPYKGNEDVENIKVSASVKYISSVYGEYTFYDTEIQTWAYSFEDSDVDTKTTYSHSENYTPVTDPDTGEETKIWDCDKHGTSETKNYWTKSDWNCISGWYIKVSVTGNLEQTGENSSTVMQNMKQPNGQITWDVAEANAEIKIEDMEIAGYVWEDEEQGKAQEINGKKDEKDTPLANIEVRLYESDGTLAIVEGTNPVLTDENGYYSFTGVIPVKKYYVMFAYDGMVYTNTYGAGKPEYNTPEWNASSKGSELVNERALFNEGFITIGSYPKGYKVSKAIFTGDYLTDGYNEIFDINSNEKITYYKGKITEKLSKYLETHNRLEDKDYIKQIYEPIIEEISDKNEKIIAKKLLQFIWDCRINSYAGHESIENGKESINGLYPYKKKVVLTDYKGEKVTADREKTINGYYVIYNGQLHVNQGVIKRSHTNLELTEDLYQTVVSINGKDVTYNYGALSGKQIGLTAADLMSYTQNVAYSDYNYRTTSSQLSSDLATTAQYPDGYAPIQIYITYKIKVKNTSNIMTSVDEIAAYINTQYYSYSDTYTTTQGKILSGIRATTILNDVETDVNAKINANSSSKYGASSEAGKQIGTDLYISFDEDIVLENEQSVAVYVTYRLGENSTKDSKFNCTYNNGRGNAAYVILQDVLKEDTAKLEVGTQSEINGFRTFYAVNANDESKYSNYYKQINGYRYRAAGVLDINSIPGNLNITEIKTAETNKGKEQNDRKPVEDDWDNATTLVLKKSGDRSLSGNVWETVGQDSKYWLDNNEYPQYNDSFNVKDITVEMIELKDGKEYVRASTTTNEVGEYRFEGYIPGDYTIRFVYGDKAKYNTVQHSPYTTFVINGSTMNCAYNGQFYQSTKANPKTNETIFWYANEEGTRYSDAYDETSIRNKIYTDLQEYTYKDIINVLKHPEDKMAYAYTSVLDIYPEKAKTETTAQNPGYTISNIDFGLTPRTITDLQIKKEVSHVKLILQNGMVQFDADTATIREQGVPGVVQAAQGYDINISMSSELVNGATLEITYTVTVTNNSPKETITYYKDSNGNVIALGLYNEDASQLVYCEDAIRVYKNEAFTKQPDSTYISKVNAGTTELVTLDSNKTEVIETKTRALAIADFVPNNLNFIKNDYTGRAVNDAWNLYTGSRETMEKEYYKQYDDASQPDIANINAEEIYNSNEIVLASANNPLLATNLASGESVSENIVLSKVISVDKDSSDTKSYMNKVRIIKIYNSNSKIQDMVSAESEKVIVSDPTGIGNKYLVIAIVLISFIIIAVGIVLIKKFAIPKK